jgi:hypothetical protein
MKQRCLSSSSADYALYGARGIGVSPLWVNDYEAFRRYVGARPSPKHSLDRIDNDGNYEPGNVRWATTSQQARNRRSTRRLSAFGETLSVIEWSERFGVGESTIRLRLERGWVAERAVKEPAHG